MSFNFRTDRVQGVSVGAGVPDGLGYLDPPVRVRATGRVVQRAPPVLKSRGGREQKALEMEYGGGKVLQPNLNGCQV